MCKAFSCIVERCGKVHWEFGVDSHADLVEKAGLKDTKVPPDFAKVEIVPRNGNYLKPDKWDLKIDEEVKPAWWHGSHAVKARKAHKDWLAKLDSIIVKRELVNPFTITPPKIGPEQKKLLKAWASVWASVWDSVGASVWDSVGASVGDSVWAPVGASVWASVWDSVWASVWDSVRDSVRDSVWDSVRDSVWDSVRASVGSMFNLPREAWQNTENIKTKGYPFQPVVDLWNMGLVPSFDGKSWRLHGGPKAEVLYEWTPRPTGEKKVK